MTPQGQLREWHNVGASLEAGAVPALTRGTGDQGTSKTMSKVAYALSGSGLLRCLLAVLALTLVLATASVPGALAQTATPSSPPPDSISTHLQNNTSASDIWKAIRKGRTGLVSIPDSKAGQLIQSEGEVWRNFHNGYLTVYGAYALLGTIVFLSLFFLLRGRVRIDDGFAGVTVERFGILERFSHWLMAGSFIILALTGLNMLFGRHVLLPVIGKPAFADLTMWGKYAHHYVAFAFMGGAILAFLQWVVHNIPGPSDVKWLLAGGGLFTPGKHPPSKKFNAGQKIIFWLVVLGALSASLSGIALMFPFQTHFMAKTFSVLNGLGAALPTDLSPLAEQQFEQIWHAAVGIAFTCLIFAHIYIGTAGMEGAFDAMGTGQVDVNWARQHHDLWLEEVEAKAAAGDEAAGPQPAE